MGSAFGKIGVEVPKHEVLATKDFYEVRKYPPAVAAETPCGLLSDPLKKSDNGDAFRRLAAYIGVFGNPKNAAQGAGAGEAIAMTAPVVTQAEQQPSSEAIAMTAPVVTCPEPAASGVRVMQFLLPAKYTIETAPKPLDPKVSLREVAPRVMAVHKFSGWATKEDVEKKEAALLAALEADKVTVVGVPILFRYNPPWTLGPLRTNEVAVQVKLEAPQASTSQ